jgi:hypothetical protein
LALPGTLAFLVSDVSIALEAYGRVGPAAAALAVGEGASESRASSAKAAWSTPWGRDGRGTSVVVDGGEAAANAAAVAGGAQVVAAAGVGSGIVVATAVETAAAGSGGARGEVISAFFF